MRILFVEDDPLLADGLSQALRHAGYSVDWVGSGILADTLLAEQSYDLAILDLGLPGLGGGEVLRRLRQRGQGLPALILSACDALVERVRLLDLGADDYLVKPVAFRELEARIRALMRRCNDGLAPSIRIGTLSLDLLGKRAQVDGLFLSLTAREWAALEFLAMNANCVVSKKALSQLLDGEQAALVPNTVDKLVSRLRAKLASASVRIRTVRGLGFYLESPAELPGT